MAWLTCSPDSVKKIKWTIMDKKIYLEKTLYRRQCNSSIQMTTNHFLHNLKVTNKGQEGIEAVNLMMDELAHRFSLPSSDLGQKQSTS